MKIKILLIIVLGLFNLISFAQCETRNYIDIANKVFTGNLKNSDFEGDLFFTIDTVNSERVEVPSSYTEFSDPLKLIESFNQTMKSIGIIGGFFNYYEFINNSLFNSPLHQSFLVNNSRHTYRIDIWNNPNNVTKINGLSIVRYNELLERTNY